MHPKIRAELDRLLAKYDRQRESDNRIEAQAEIILETLCPECEGKGGQKPMYERGWERCLSCDGAGYIPTPLGERIMGLVQHQLYPPREL